MFNARIHLSQLPITSRIPPPSQVDRFQSPRPLKFQLIETSDLGNRSLRHSDISLARPESIVHRASCIVHSPANPTRPLAKETDTTEHHTT
ncbi:hypothetical protein BofuT4_P134780.1 [Botrytis cinerea T4]|uniref:Uncharacterized protein n=1 Tax=Botryotinia fuckeliana (strain T4) TaxID=999810 RepID=G2YP85_BOTF4|nr:hypothetical protein BofuT4_P134780.1 [Botrytis cinerea T4]